MSHVVSARSPECRRRRRIGIQSILAALLLTFGLGVPASAKAFAAADSSWVAQSSGITTQLSGVSFCSATAGYAVGWSGKILATNTGGATWIAQDSGVNGWTILYGVACTDPGHGWAVGTNGTILVNYGGGTWSAQVAGTNADFWAVAFSDATHGWAVGTGGTVVATTNGGASWSSQSSGTTEALTAVACSDATHAWATSWNGIIVATTNGGASWSPQSSGTTQWLTGVAFSDATHGWAVGVGGTILATTNGGASWSAQSSGTTATLNAVAFSDATHGWAVGGGAILATTNGGATWSVQISGTDKDFTGVAFSDATHGWAVGAGGIILATTAGGWLSDTTGPTTSAKAASGRKGHAIDLEYRIDDNLSAQASNVTLLVKNANGTVVKRFDLGTKSTATWYTVKWRPGAKGTYRYSVYAKDLAGNAQSKVGSAKVTVR
jgi:photosystem II stability/assembly factor-like uncharacterized protein